MYKLVKYFNLLNMKTIPTVGDQNWGSPLNAHLAQLSDPNLGGFNTSPLASPTANDEGHCYVDLATKNWYRFDGAHYVEISTGIIYVDDFIDPTDNPQDADANAIQAAVDYLKSTYTNIGSNVIPRTAAYEFVLNFKPRIYSVNKSINMTDINRRNNTWVVNMVGATIIGKAVNKALFDLTDSRSCNWLGGDIVGDETDTPAAGILMGRRGTDNQGNPGPGPNADLHTLQNVIIRGSFTKASIYNVGSENLTILSCDIWNNYNDPSSYAAIFDGSNTMGMTSDFVNPILSSDSSFNELLCVGTKIKKYNAGSAVFLNRSNIAKFFQVFVVSQSASGFVLDNSNVPCRSLTIDGHIESIVNPPGVQESIKFIDTAGTNRPYILRNFKYVEHAMHSPTFISIDNNISELQIHNANIAVDSVHGQNTSPVFCDDPAKLKISGHVSLLDDQNRMNLNNIGGMQGTLIAYDRLAVAANTGNYKIIDINGVRNIGTP